MIQAIYDRVSQFQGLELLQVEVEVTLFQMAVIFFVHFVKETRQSVSVLEVLSCDL